MAAMIAIFCRFAEVGLRGEQRAKSVIFERKTGALQRILTGDQNSGPYRSWHFFARRGKKNTKPQGFSSRGDSRSSLKSQRLFFTSSPKFRKSLACLSRHGLGDRELIFPPGNMRGQFFARHHSFRF